jgi:hypothetical protein
MKMDTKERLRLAYHQAEIELKIKACGVAHVLTDAEDFNDDAMKLLYDGGHFIMLYELEKARNDTRAAFYAECERTAKSTRRKNNK